MNRVILGKPMFVEDIRSRRPQAEIPEEFDSVIGKKWRLKNFLDYGSSVNGTSSAY